MATRERPATGARKPTLRRRRIATLGVALASLAGSFAFAPQTPTASAACSISANLALGARGSAVQCVQATLNALGYNAGPIDGAFGQMTYRAVRAFQQAKGLTVDGVVGRQTATALGIWGTSTTPPSTGGGCKVSIVLRLGSTGSQVSCLQQALNAAGYPVGTADGKFGSRTLAAVRSYQQAKRLVVDGIAGRQTLTALGIWGTPTTSPPSNSCTPPAGVPSTARQVVIVTPTGASRADVDLLVHDGTRWTCSRMDMAGRVGRNGTRALSQRRSGDGTTPAGIFPLGTMQAPDGQVFQFFGNGVNPGVRGTWRQVKPGDCWAAIPNRPSYNSLVTRTSANCQSPDEYLINFQQAYSRAAIIGANLGPNRSGDAVGEAPLAAAIFLHRHSYDAGGNARPTSGCVSLGNENLIYVLQRLTPGQAYFVIRLG